VDRGAVIVIAIVIGVAAVTLAVVGAFVLGRHERRRPRR
jgi:hypothetical protein